ncbi:MAG: FIST N-terminal domain-containing protein, partial [Planctomycetota bacterium]
SFVPDEASQATAVKADIAAEQAAAKAIDAVCGPVPNIGCRARSLVNGGTLLKNSVAVLALGGAQADVGVAAVPITDNRRATGEQVAEAMKNVRSLDLIIALAEMRLSFEAKEGVSVEDFIRGVLDNGPRDLNLLGGNSMPDDMAAADLAGAQFYNGTALKGYVVAMGIGGPIRTFGNHNNEFKASQKTVTVTDTRDKWVISFDGKPAAEVYRELRGMKPDEQFTSDWQHPIGVVVAPGKEYVRMILNWVGPDGKDKDGKETDLPAGSLSFVAPVVKGTKVKVFAGGDDARAIVSAAADGVGETMKEAKKAGVKPVLCLLSNCCARGMRLRSFRQGNDDEVTEAIIPSMKKEIPLFGFYAWGELGKIKGQYQGMGHQYQQHTFVSAVVAIEE